MLRSDIRSVVDRAMLAIAKPGDSQSRDSVFFDKTTVFAYNDRYGVMLPFDSGITCGVMGEPLNKLLKASKTLNVELTLEKGELSVVSGKSSASIPLVTPKLLAKYMDIMPDKDDWRPLPDRFNTLAGIAYMPNRTNADNTDGLFMCQEVLMSGTSNWICHVEAEMNLPRLWISSGTFKSLLKFGVVKEYAQTDSVWMHFRGDQGIFSCRQLNAQGYPMEKFFEVEKNWSENGVILAKGTFNKETVATLKEAVIFSEESKDVSLPVTMEFSGAEMVLHTEGAFGSFQSAVPMDSEVDEPILITTDLARLLMAMDRGDARFELRELRRQKALVLRGDGWQVLITAKAKDGRK